MSAMTIELPEQLQAELKDRASARGVSPDLYLREVLERDFGAEVSPTAPLKSSYGMLAKYGPAPSADEIDESRADMLRTSIFAMDAE